MRVFLDEDYVLPVCCLCGKPDKRSRVKIHRDSFHFLKRYVCSECERGDSA
jgi:transposase-like protein